ncbi:hypothetical protein EC973_002975 [Apophysomyces ossiformis]|uniref:Aminotransferase class I/classII large domain-containing protein n=1 Tax=Apophysomyces ossiformis TaxID=679940 RepID=A0A8H7BMY8_9FUNG|nr:hypothetical protein EC973_002975 [Apophysomyces ossiformis]
MFDLLDGRPSLELLPTRHIAQATQRALELPDAATNMLQYGRKNGEPEFLRQLANFLSEQYGATVVSRQLYGTSGASHSLERILTILTRPQGMTRFAIFQNPTYHLVFKVFENVGFHQDQFVGISDRGDGLDVDELERFLQSHLSPDTDSALPVHYAAVLYCVPTHANPTSSVLSPERRSKLVDLARKYNVLVICDDVYDLLTYGSLPPPKRVVAYDVETKGKPVVISNGSFSKLLAPGIRVGWIEAQEAIIDRFTSSGSDISGGQSANFSEC